MVIGVYAAKQAQLNISGSIGFTAHDCEVVVSGEIKNASKTKDGQPEDITLQEVHLGGDYSSSGSIDIGSIYFCDLTESGEPLTITITLNVTNKSIFDVEAVLTNYVTEKITITNDKTSMVLASNASDIFTINFSLNKDSNGNYYEINDENLSFGIDFHKDVSYSINKVSVINNTNDIANIDFLTISDYNNLYSANTSREEYIQGKIKKVNFKNTSEITAIYLQCKMFESGTDKQLESVTLLYEDDYTFVLSSDVYFSIDVCKYSKTKSTIEVLKDSTVNSLYPYYIEYGEYNATKIKWIIIGVDNGTGQMGDFIPETDLQLVDDKYYMYENKIYYYYSQYVLPTTESDDYSLSYQNNMTKDSNNVDYTYDNIYACDYSASNLRNFYKGNTVSIGSTSNSTTKTSSPSGKTTNFYDLYKLKDDDIYNLILGRSLKDLYKEAGIDSSKVDANNKVLGGEEIEVPQHEKIDYSKDKFWALSYREWYTNFYLKDNTNSSAIGYELGNKTSKCLYWLRTFIPNDKSYLWPYIVNYGGAAIKSNQPANTDWVYQRPAFRI